ncbi:MAG: hypothetical protein ACRC6M_02080 [Microcystaceae cyanobacterium]
MAISREQVHQKIIEIHQVMDINSLFYGRLVNWYEGVSWHYGIGLQDDLIFDTGGFSIFTRNPNEFFLVPDVHKFSPHQTIERLCYAIACFKDWDYGLLGWNCEHIARLVASDSAVSYEIKKLPFPIPQLNHDGWHPDARDILKNFIDQNQYLISDALNTFGD